jgi:fructan beta-fructosidase
MSNWRYATKVPTHPWRSAMTAPRRLSLVRDADGYRLTSEPIAALAALRKAAFTINPGGELPAGLAAGGELDLRIAAPPGSEGSFTVELSNRLGEQLQFGLDSKRGWFVDRRRAGQSAWHPEFASLAQAPRALSTRTATLRVLIDRSSVELFADGGRVAMTETFFPGEPFSAARLRLTGEYRLASGRAWLLGDGRREGAALPVASVPNQSNKTTIGETSLAQGNAMLPKAKT